MPLGKRKRSEQSLATTTAAVQSTHTSSEAEEETGKLFEEEAELYYYGLPSRPRLIARSSATTIPWMRPTGLEAYSVHKELRVVGNHPLSNGIWENRLAPPFLSLLESEAVKWTSVDVVRIGIVKEPFAPVILWIGVMPGTLAPADGLVVADKCKSFLEENDIIDVHVELRESMAIGCAGPKFLSPTNVLDSTLEVRRHLTLTLGPSICSASTPWAEGTGGFFMAEGGDSKKIFLITARHVLFPPEKNADYNNDLYEYKNTSQPRRNVFLLGDRGFNNLRGSIDKAIERASGQGGMVEYHQKRVQWTEGKKGHIFEKQHEKTLAELNKWERWAEAHETFRNYVLKNWSNSGDRILGHVIFAPPLCYNAGIAGYTEDLAVVEIDRAKLTEQNFLGNVIDLGTVIDYQEFTQKMHPHPSNPHSFSYPYEDHLLHIQGIIPVQEMCSPTVLDEDGKPCLMVMKRGTATGLTIGPANNIVSYKGHYPNDMAPPQYTKEWPIFSYNNKNLFSEPGDSGALVIDGRGRMVSLITGGVGTEKMDITYSTPIEILQTRIAAAFPHAHFNPVLS